MSKAFARKAPIVVIDENLAACGGIDISTANSLWGQSGVEFEKPFLDELRELEGERRDVDQVHRAVAATGEAIRKIDKTTKERFREAFATQHRVKAETVATAIRIGDRYLAGESHPLLVTLENFAGWKRDPAWADDLDFQASHGNDIARIAIVGDPRWRDEALVYVGKGFRRTEGEFFAPASLDAARAWLLR